MTDKELLKQALNALERNVQHKYPYAQDAAIRLGEDAVIALTARLEQPEDEPAAYSVYFPDDQRREYCDELDDLCEDLTNCRHEITPLYAAAPVSANCNWPSCKSEEYQKALAIDVGDAIIGKAPHDREWVGLTDEDMTELDDDCAVFARYVEAKLKEKNT